MDYFRNHQAKRHISRRDWNFAPLFALAVLLILPLASCGGSGSSSSGGPVANAGGPYFTNVGQAITLSGSGSSAPSGQSLAYSWNFGDGTTGTGVSPSHTYTISGDFTLALTVTDTSGATNMTTVGIQVFPSPVANPGGPYSGTVGQSITFSGAGSSAPPGDTLGYAWNFGDGGTGSGVAPSHAYGATGTFTVSLTVTDNTSGANSNTTKAVISAGGSVVPAGAASNVTVMAMTSASSNMQRFAYVASSTGNTEITLSTEVVDAATGLLIPTSNPTLTLDGQLALSGIALDPTSKFLYLYGGTTILNFVVDPVSGALTQQGSIVTNGNVQSGGLLVFPPAGGFALLPTADASKANSTDADIVTVYSVDPTTGVLTSTGTFSSQVQNPNAAATDTLGKYLYVFGTEAGSTDGPSRIAGFSINQQTGALSPLPGSPFAVASRITAVAMAVDHTGRFFYAAGSSAITATATVSTFSMNGGTGALTELSNSPISVGSASSSAVSLSLDPSGAFAYVMTSAPVSESTAQQAIQVFSLDAATGAPALINTQLVGTFALNSAAVGGATVISSPVVSNVQGTPASKAISSSGNEAGRGKFLYVTNPSDGSVLVFLIDAATGLLNSVSPITTSKNQ